MKKLDNVTVSEVVDRCDITCQRHFSDSNRKITDKYINSIEIKVSTPETHIKSPSEENQ